tara:strand:+ start:241 stop:678 length:438 start_codon:yes stop_codon:yes gene_type:complete
MESSNIKIIVPIIFTVLLLSAHAVSGAQACVDCDLDKNFKIINTKVVEDKILYNDVRKVKNDTEQYCFVKIVIKEKDGVVSKEEELYCSDGRKGIDTPSYWELFAQFYYRDIATPEYCRYYSRKNHAFKSFGKVCLNENGEWKVK